MQKLVQGIHNFQCNIFGSQRKFFERLADGQTPETLFITCSDSRINPNLLTQTEPGELFILRNAGNIVPPHSTMPTGEEATIEFAVAGLGVRDIVVCGHSHCGAMKGLLHPEMLTELPAMSEWLRHAAATQRIIRDKYKHLTGHPQLTATVEENVLVQLENLRTHPTVASALACNKVKLHGWVYKFETGEVFAFDPMRGQFQPIQDRAQPLAVNGAAIPVLVGSSI